MILMDKMCEYLRSNMPSLVITPAPTNNTITTQETRAGYMYIKIEK